MDIQIRTAQQPDAAAIAQLPNHKVQKLEQKAIANFIYPLVQSGQSKSRLVTFVVYLVYIFAGGGTYG